MIKRTLIALLVSTTIIGSAHAAKVWLFGNGGAGVFGGGGSGPTACTPGAIDLSLTTGCNIPFYVGGIFP